MTAPFPLIPLKRFGRIVGGATPRDDERHWGGGIPWYTPGDVSAAHAQVLRESARTLTPEGLRSCSAVMLPARSVILTSRAPVGNVAINDRPAATNQGCKSLIPADGVDARFVAYAARALCTEIQVASTGTTFQEISGERLGMVRFPCASHHEQRRIGDFLDQEIARIRLASTSISNAAQRLKAIERLIADSVVDGAGSVPLKAVATIHSGVTLNESKTFEDAVDVPYLRVANVKAGWLDLEEIKEVPVPVADVERLRLRDGDLLLTEGGDLDKLGRGALWESQLPLCVFQNHVFAVRPRDGVTDARFLSWATRSCAARTYFESTASRITNIASTNKAKLGRWPVPNLPLEEQLRRVEVAEAAWAKARRSISAARQVHDRLGEYRDSLIHEAVTGGLDVTQMSEQQMEERLHAAREGQLDEVTA